MYISLWENSRGHPDNVSFMQFSMKIYGFEQKDSQGYENSYNLYEQYPLEKFFHFHHLPKLYFGLKKKSLHIKMYVLDIQFVPTNDNQIFSTNIFRICELI